MRLSIFRIIGVILAWVGLHFSLKREDRLMLNASPSFERSCRHGRYSKCKATAQQQAVNTAGCLVALLASAVCLVDAAVLHSGGAARIASFGLLAIPVAVVIDFIILFRARKRLRKWILITGGKKHLTLKEQREAMRRMKE